MTDAKNKTRWNLTTLPDAEWVERLAVSFEHAANAASPEIAEWYRQEAAKVRAENVSAEIMLQE
jgi:hypothetical protein